MSIVEALRAGGWRRASPGTPWRTSGGEPLGYSDGDDAESRLLDCVRTAGDRSSGSADLRRAIVDWTTEYHLSVERANLLRPLHIRPQERVLELGAGCGALTRWLGETGAEVVAVEGSPRRAQAAALRCEDLGNVHVVEANLLGFDIDARFDWVLLVGVLEYAPRYADGTEPSMRYLERAARLVTDAGHLVLAIENQMGMKYFAGCAEDHVGRRFYGVYDLYQDREPRTFGRRTLDAMLERAGFLRRELLIPMPDYKLPQVVVRGDGRADRLHVGDLLLRSFARDYTGSRWRSLSETLSWEAAARNGLLADLGNSLLFVASRAAEPATPPPFDADVLAWSYSTRRRSGHRVETLVRANGEGIAVDKRDVDRGPSVAISSRFVRVRERNEYIPGAILSGEIARCLARDAAEPSAMTLLARWIDALLASPERGLAHSLPGRLVDAVPGNTILRTDGSLAFFDLEWQSRTPIPLEFVVLRGLLGLVHGLDEPGPWRDRTVLDLGRELLAPHGCELDDEAVRRAIELDAELLREAVFGDDASPVFPMRDDTLLAPIAGRVDLADRLDEVLRDALHAADEGARELQRLSEETRVLRDMHRDEQERHTRNIGLLHEASSRAHSASEALREALRARDESVLQADALRGEIERMGQRLAAEAARDAALLAASQRDADRLRAELAESAAQLAAQSAALDDATARAHRSEMATTRLESDLVFARSTLESQSRELVSLHQERNTFGGKFGRWLTGRRNAWLPPHTRRGRALTLGARLVETVAHEGPAAGGRRVLEYAGKHARRQARATGSASTSAVAEPHDFALWIDRNEPDAHELEQQRLRASELPLRPLVSVILPVYKVPTAVLAATLDSLLAQTYENWEACIAYADVDEEHWNLLDRYQSRDRRFRPFRVDNRGIAGNSNAALAIARGEYVALLDHDDTLAPSALFRVVRAIASSEGRPADFFYTDKDSIEADGKVRCNPLFKPRWSPEMLYSVNYLTHFNVMRRELVDSAGGWISEMDGAQDWDLFLRVCERARGIERVEGIGYHWRILPTSVATGIAAKPYAALAQLRCQQERIRRLGLNATVVPHDESGFHLQWPAPTAGTIDIVVHSAETSGGLRRCLDSLRFASLPPQTRIRVVRPRADEGIDDVLEDFRRVWLDALAVEPRATSGDPPELHCLLAAAHAPVAIALDGRAAAVDRRCIEELAGWLTGHDEIAWVGALALEPGDLVVEAGRVVDATGRSAPLFKGTPLRSWGRFGGALWYRNVSCAAPYAFAVRSRDVRATPFPLGDAQRAWSLWCAALCATGRRGLVDPHARIHFDADPEPNALPGDPAFGTDPYFHPAFLSVNPLRLAR